MHADGAGTKSALAYMYWKETGDLSVWKVRASLSRQQARPSILTLDLASTLLWKEFRASGSGRAYGAMWHRTRACSFATRIVSSPRTQLTVAYAEDAVAGTDTHSDPPHQLAHSHTPPPDALKLAADDGVACCPGDCNGRDHYESRRLTMCRRDGQHPPLIYHWPQQESRHRRRTAPRLRLPWAVC